MASLGPEITTISLSEPLWAPLSAPGPACVGGHPPAHVCPLPTSTAPALSLQNEAFHYSAPYYAAVTGEVAPACLSGQPEH